MDTYDIKILIKELFDEYDKNQINMIDDGLLIDYIDIFPKSCDEKERIEKLLEKNSNNIFCDEKGKYFVLKNYVSTDYGKLKIIKVRIFDINKINTRGAVDFKCNNYDLFKEKVKNNKEVYVIKRVEDELIEIPIGKNFIYISNKPKTNNI